MATSEITLGVQLRTESATPGDVGVIVDAFQDLVAVPVWAFLAMQEGPSDAYRVARTALHQSVGEGGVGDRYFFPGFVNRVTEVGVDWPFGSDERFDPLDPLDAAVVTGINSWLRRALRGEAPDAYQEIFRFARISRAEHRSPLFIALTVSFGTALLGPPLIVYASMRAIHSLRRMRAEADIREEDAAIRREERRQQELRTQVLEKVTAEFRETGLSETLDPALIESVIQVSAAPIADLGTNPLIGQVTLGVSTGAGEP